MQNQTARSSLPLRPIPDDLATTVDYCLDQANTARALAVAASARPIRDVYLVGVGGSLFTHFPLAELLNSYGKSFATHTMTANEFNYAPPARLGEASLVISASHSGETPEAVAAARLGASRGAIVATVSSHSETSLARAGTYSFTYNSDTTVVDAKHVLLHQLGLELLAATEALEAYTPWRVALEAMPQVLPSAKQQAVEASNAIAAQLHDETITYILGSGASYGAAMSLAMCYLQEMQWMHAAAVNSGDFLHGPFEVVQPETAFILLLSEATTRPIDERALSFLRRYSNKVFTVDTADLAMPGVVAEARPFVSPVVLGSVVTRMIAFYEHHSGHNKDDRRYMWKVDY